jgi:HSP20 family protein
MYHFFNTTFKDFDKDFDKVFDKFGKSFNESFGATFGDFPNEAFIEQDGKLIVSLDVPGVDKKDVTVDYDSRILSVAAKRNEDKTYSGKWRITQLIDPDNITAKLENGVLVITLTKKDSEKGKKIVVD